ADVVEICAYLVDMNDFALTTRLCRVFRRKRTHPHHGGGASADVVEICAYLVDMNDFALTTRLCRVFRRKRTHP
uniref:hypothetical protein n=1 Tax=Aquitalea magnusonii TaxID=332411 RepID=UPI001956E986